MKPKLLGTGRTDGGTATLRLSIREVREIDKMMPGKCAHVPFDRSAQSEMKGIRLAPEDDHIDM